MAILNISFSLADYKQLLAGDLDLSNFLKIILKDDTSGSILEHLTKYHSQNGDNCHINEFEVTSSSMHVNQTSGTVLISYLIQYHYGCADITRQAKDHETWRFDINKITNTLLLHMPDYEVRSTHDEF
jgi:hypothetical protein